MSIDGILASNHGICEVDYPRFEYERYQDEADKIFLDSIQQLLDEGKDNVILDRSFYAKEDRDFYKELVQNKGGRLVLVYLKATKDVLWRRICARREASINADSALEISEELLDTYFDGFEVPKGEGEIVVDTVA